MMENIDFSYCVDPYSSSYSRFENICRYAVDRSSSHLEDIFIKRFVSDDLLLYIAHSTSNLRWIRLEGCYKISSEVFSEVVKKEPLLEVLEIYHCPSIGIEFFNHIGKCCPLLKSLNFCPCYRESKDKDYNVAFTIAKTMSQLRRLMILNNEVTNDGLLAILDGCPHLESLDVRGCHNLDLDGSLGKRCTEQIKEFRFRTEAIYLASNSDDHTQHLVNLFVSGVYKKLMYGD